MRRDATKNLREDDARRDATKNLLDATKNLFVSQGEEGEMRRDATKNLSSVFIN